MFSISQCFLTASSKESVRQGCNIDKRIENLLNTKQYLKIIETKPQNNNLINIGDILRVKIHYIKMMKLKK